MNTELLTPREIQIRERWQSITKDYQKLRSENPEASKHRIINAIANNYNMSGTWIRKILIRQNLLQ